MLNTTPHGEQQARVAPEPVGGFGPAQPVETRRGIRIPIHGDNLTDPARQGTAVPRNPPGWARLALGHANTNPVGVGGCACNMEDRPECGPQASERAGNGREQFRSTIGLVRKTVRRDAAPRTRLLRSDGPEAVGP